VCKNKFTKTFDIIEFGKYCKYAPAAENEDFKRKREENKV
jgi:hypothetical protein